MHGPAQSPLCAIKQETCQSSPAGWPTRGQRLWPLILPLLTRCMRGYAYHCPCPSTPSQSESHLSLRVGIVDDAYHILGPICRANTDHADVFVDEWPVSAAALQRAPICALPARLAALPARLAGRCLTGVDVLRSVSVSEAKYPQHDRVAS